MLDQELELSTPTQPQDETLGRLGAMLGLMAELGMPREAVAQLAEFGGIEFDLKDRDFFAGPIILHQSQWMSSVPEWAFDQIGAERMDILTGKLECAVGPTEIMAVMYPATMDAPMEYALSRVYLWASCHAMARWKNTTFDAIRDNFYDGDPDFPTDEMMFDGRSQENFHYRQIVHAIRTKVTAAGAERRKAAARAGKTSPPAERPVEPTQYDLFGTSSP